MPFIRTALAAMLIAGGVPAIAVADTGISFEQFDRTYFNVPDTSKGNFSSDATALRAERNGASDQYPAIPQSGQPLAAGASKHVTARLQRFSFLGNLVRVDDLITNKSTISDPDSGRVILLDTFAKTYRTLTGDEAKKMSAPFDRSAIEETLGAQTAKGSETIVITTTSKPVGTREIEGITAVGTSTRIQLSTRDIVGACLPTNQVIDSTTFVDPNRSEPANVSSQPPGLITGKTNFTGCNMTVEKHVATGPADEHFMLIRKSSIVTNVASLHLSFTVHTTLERGNIVVLTDADAGRFTVPDGFTPQPPLASPIAEPAAGR